MFCTSCGTKNAADNNFCKQCGSKLDRAAAAKINQDDFERALPEDEQMSTLLERAYRLRKESDVEGAIGLCEEALRLRADSTSAHSLLGQLYEEKGDREAAIREYERVLHLNPGSIADRVKLDELRSKGEEGSERKPHTRVVMADPHVMPGLGYARFTSVGVGLALLVLGGLVALQFRPRTAVPAASPTDTSISRASVNGSPANGANATGTTMATTTGTGVSPSLSGTTPDKVGTGAATASNSAVPNAAPVPNSAVTPPVTNPTAANGNPTPASPPASVAPTVIYQQGPIRYVPVPTAAAPNVAGGARLPGIKRPKTNAGNNTSGGLSPNGTYDGTASGNGSGRIILNGDPDVTESNGKTIVKVNPADVSGKPDASGKKGDSDGNSGNGFSRIVVDKTPSGATRMASPAAPASSTESRSFLAVGDDKKRQHDYKGAIDAFTKSLASAGDQMGYVLQQRALCYQQLNELSSAKADYERAINEYRKLEARDPETARNGVRACEKGIKTCGN